MLIDRNDLARAIAYVLWEKSKLIPRAKQRNGWPPSIEDYLVVATALIEQLDTSGYGFIKRPPLTAHTSGGSRAEPAAESALIDDALDVWYDRLHREERRLRMRRVLELLRKRMEAGEG